MEIMQIVRRKHNISLPQSNSSSFLGRAPLGLIYPWAVYDWGGGGPLMVSANVKAFCIQTSPMWPILVGPPALSQSETKQAQVADNARFGLTGGAPG